MTADRQRKSTPAKSSASKSPAASHRKQSAKGAPDPGDEAQGSQPARRRASAPSAESRPRVAAKEVATKAARELAGLTGKPAEAITGIAREEDGWRVTVEVLELRRIPETTDVLARYEIDADDRGSLMSYRR